MLSASDDSERAATIVKDYLEPLCTRAAPLSAVQRGILHGLGDLVRGEFAGSRIFAIRKSFG